MTCRVRGCVWIRHIYREIITGHQTCAAAPTTITRTVTKVQGNLFALAPALLPESHGDKSRKLLSLHRQLVIAGNLFTLKGAILGEGDNHSSVTILKDCILVHAGTDSHGGGYVLHGTNLAEDYNSTLQAEKELRYVLYEKTEECPDGVRYHK